MMRMVLTSGLNCPKERKVSEMRLFILEDDKKQIKLYRDAIGEYSRTKNIEITAEFADNLDDALRKLKTDNFDAAIIDLKLSGADTEGKGNKAIREIRENLRFPVFVMTGFIDELDADLREQNVFYKTYRNTDKSVAELLDEIMELYNTGITNILGKKGKIESALQEIFWKHIAVNMDYWKSEISNPQECEKILLRHILVYLTGYLEMDEAGEFLCFNAAEFYIIPPIRKYIFTGDILKKKDDGKFFIVLTPACDLAQGKAKDITLAFIEGKDMEFVTQQKRILTAALPADATNEQKKKKDEARNLLERLLKNSLHFKYHFLPPTAQFPGGFINFQKVTTVQLSGIDAEFERVVSVTEKFAKDLIARFSHYYARQGQPDLNIEDLMKKILQ